MAKTTLPVDDEISASNLIRPLWLASRITGVLSNGFLRVISVELTSGGQN